MRIVGYVRESVDPAERTAFAQQERLRRYAKEHGHRLVAICQDVRSPGATPARDGYVSMLGVIASGGVDAVLVPDLDTLSSDAIVQEIVLWDLRERGVRILSAEPADLTVLDADTSPGAERLVIRDVLERVGEHERAIGGGSSREHSQPPDTDVVVQIIAADAAE